MKSSFCMLRKCADCSSKKNDTDCVTPWDEFLYHDPTLVFSTLAVDADHCGPHHQSAFCLESYLTTEKPKMFYGLLPCVEPIVRKTIQISNSTAEQNNAGDLACYPFSELAGKKTEHTADLQVTQPKPKKRWSSAQHRQVIIQAQNSLPGRRLLPDAARQPERRRLALRHPCA